jgi:hypothetical protein
LHSSFHALLVKGGVIGAGDLDGEPLVVVAHGRYYNRSEGGSHGFFQNLFVAFPESADVFVPIEVFHITEEVCIGFETSTEFSIPRFCLVTDRTLSPSIIQTRIKQDICCFIIHW